MSRGLTALFAAFEALLVLAIGIAIPLVPLTILWGFEFGLALDWLAFWRSAVDIWLIGHGVDVQFALDPALAAGLGLPGAEAPFAMTIAALGFTLLTLLLAVRAGRRVSETQSTLLGLVVSLVTFGGLSFLVTYTAQLPQALPNIVQGTVLPTLVFALGAAIGVLIARRDREPGSRDVIDRIRSRIRLWPDPLRVGLGTALRGGAAAAAGVIGAAAVVLALTMIVSFSRIIALYQSLHTEVLGGISLTLAQLAFLPNAVIYTMSWLVGPGFALGTGSSVSPIGTQLGPIPAIPILGALPESTSAFGYIGLLVPVVIAFLTGAIVRPALRPYSPALRVGVAVGIGVVAGVILGLLAAISAGAAGPGRLVDVGPDALLVGLVAAPVVAVASYIGMLATGVLPRQR